MDICSWRAHGRIHDINDPVLCKAGERISLQSTSREVSRRESLIIKS